MGAASAKVFAPVGEPTDQKCITIIILYMTQHYRKYLWDNLGVVNVK